MPSSRAERFDFFLSRRGSVAAIAREVTDVLTEKGYRVFVQDYDVPFTESAHKARVVSDAGCTAIIALLDVATEHRHPAPVIALMTRRFDAPEMTGACLSKRFAIAAEDIRHLQSRNHGSRSAGRHELQAEPIERARRVADRFGGDSSVACRAREAGMAEQDLDDAHVSHSPRDG